MQRVVLHHNMGDSVITLYTTALQPLPAMMENGMALYQSAQFVDTWTDPEFDKIHPPRTVAPHSGIYRCVGCGVEIAVVEGQLLPSIHAHPHRLGTREAWQMIVYADHRHKPG